jgi:ABC-type transport system involved in cytochrome c biogenesis permease subunit
MTHTAAILAISLYVLTSGLLGYRVIRPSIGNSRTWLDICARVVFLMGLIAHTFTLCSMLQDPRISALRNGADYFFLGSWSLAVAYMILSLRVVHPILGAFLVPGVVLFMGSSSYLLHPTPNVSIVESSPTTPLLSFLHSVPALISVVSLALAFVVSTVFLIVDRGIKKKGASALAFGGPNLQVLDRLNRRLVQLGFIAISLVVLSGGLWAVSEQKPVFTFDTSVVSGLIVWVLLAAILHVRLVLKWSPKRVSRMTVIVTGIFFVSVFAVMVLAGRVTHASLGGVL